MATEFGTLVLRLREDQGLTQRELARRAGLDIGYLCRAVNGKIPISDQAVLRLADVLRASPTELLAAAHKLRYRFPYQAVTPVAQVAFRKLAEGERITRDEQDAFYHVVRCWEVRRFIDEDTGGIGVREQPGWIADAETRLSGRRWLDGGHTARTGSDRRSGTSRHEESEAEALLVEFARRYGQWDGLKTPVRSIARRLFHLATRVGDLSNYGPGVLGVLLPCEGEIWISDRIRDQGCAAFTESHEMWHFLNWWTDETGAPTRNKARRQLVESKANRFAAALLMPAPGVLDVVCRWELKDPDYRYALAQAYGVSVRAMEVRLTSLGLVTQRTLKSTHKPVKARRQAWRPERYPWLAERGKKKNVWLSTR